MESVKDVNCTSTVVAEIQNSRIEKIYSRFSEGCILVGATFVLVKLLSFLRKIPSPLLDFGVFDERQATVEELLEIPHTMTFFIFKCLKE